MTNSTISQLAASLSAEHLALQNFLSLLEKEQSLLVANLTQDVLELSSKKISDAIQLDQLAESRRNLMHTMIVSSGRNASSTPLTQEEIFAWLEKHCGNAIPVWRKIRILAERAQQLNLVNGELIRMKMRHNQQALAALSQAADKANLYGPDGQHNFSSGGGRSLGSV
ncbi:MAG: flagellar protein FlgN [Gallionella sp.]